jgi:Ca2+/Na+ antiporter
MTLRTFIILLAGVLTIPLMLGTSRAEWYEWILAVVWLLAYVVSLDNDLLKGER